MEPPVAVSKDGYEGEEEEERSHKMDSTNRLQEWCQLRGLGNLQQAFNIEIRKTPGMKAAVKTNKLRTSGKPYRCVMRSDEMDVEATGFGFKKQDARAEACARLLDQIDSGEFIDPGHRQEKDTSKEKSWWGDALLDFCVVMFLFQEMRKGNLRSTPDTGALHELKSMFTANECLQPFAKNLAGKTKSEGIRADGTAVEAYIYDKWLQLGEDVNKLIDHLKEVGLLKIDSSNTTIDELGNPVPRLQTTMEPVSTFIPAFPEQEDLPDAPAHHFTSNGNPSRQKGKEKEKHGDLALSEGSDLFDLQDAQSEGRKGTSTPSRSYDFKPPPPPPKRRRASGNKE